MFQINQIICLVNDVSQKGFISDIPASNIYMILTWSSRQNLEIQ